MVVYLAASVNGVEEGAGVHVPKLDGPVCSAAAGGQQIGLEGAPGQGLHSSLVAQQRVQGLPPPQLPDQQPVVVAPRRQVLPVGGPLQAAHLQRVPPQLRGDVLPHPALGGRFLAAGDECSTLCNSNCSTLQASFDKASEPIWLSNNKRHHLPTPWCSQHWTSEAFG